METFFKKCPALPFALFFLLGLGFAKGGSLSLLIPLIALFSLWAYKPKKLLPYTALFLLAFSYGKITNVKFQGDKVEGKAIFFVHEIKPQKSHFKKSYLLKGVLHGVDGSFCKVPSSIPLPPSYKPGATSKYLLDGTIEKKEGRFFFTENPDSKWVEIPEKFSFLKWRFHAKSYITKKIEKRYKNPTVSNFLTALTLGNLSDSLLRFSFGSLGLQHILAISGFHFGLLALFLGRFFQLFLKEKKALIALGISLSAYFFLIGASPSILRAYLAIMLYLTGKAFGKRPSPLNIFGVVLLFDLLLQPESIKNLGFQLSFLATGAILLLLPVTEPLFKKLFPVRSKKELLNFSRLDRIGYLGCKALRSCLSLNLAVHLVMVPVCLFYFGVFPLSSFIYNLFIPPAISLSLLLLVLSPLSTFISTFNEAFTHWILKLIIESPNALNYKLSFPVREEVLFLILLALFSLPLARRPRESAC